MFHLLLLVYVMILNKNIYEKSATEDDIEKINYAGRQLGWEGAFRPDHLRCTRVLTGTVRVNVDIDARVQMGRRTV